MKRWAVAELGDVRMPVITSKPATVDSIATALTAANDGVVRS